MTADELLKNAIDTANVSHAWKTKFKKIAKALPLSFWGGYQNLSQLNLEDQKGIKFNTNAMIFGFIYYFLLGMIAKGFVITSGYVIFWFILIIFEYLTNFRIYEAIIFANLLCAQFVDYDYYMLKINNVTMWEKLSFFRSGWVAFFLCVATLLLCSMLLALGHIQTRNDLFREVSGVWENAEGKQFVIELDALNQYIKSGDETVQIEPVETDIKYGLLRFRSINSDKTVKAVNIRRKYTSDGSATLLVSIDKNPEIALLKFLGAVSEQDTLKGSQNHTPANCTRISDGCSDAPAIKLPDINEVQLSQPPLNSEAGVKRTGKTNSKNSEKAKSKKRHLSK